MLSGSQSTTVLRAARGVGPVALIVLAAGALLVLVGVVPQYQWAADDEAERVERAARVLSDAFSDAREDVLLIGREQKVREALWGDVSRRIRLEADWREFLTVKKRFDQLRLLDAKGMEIVRVQRDVAGAVTVSGEHLLQDKSGRPYFTQAAGSADGEVSVSPLDLNVETGQLERPLKPTLRYSVTYRDERGRLLGVVVLNLRAKVMLEEARAILRDSAGEYGIVNAAGYSLLAMQAGDEFGFALPDGAERTLARRDAQLWHWLSYSEERTQVAGTRLVAHVRLCSFAIGCGLGTYPASVGMPFDSSDQPWVVYTTSTAAQVLSGRLLHWRNAPVLAALAVVLLLVATAVRAAWRLARTVDVLTVSRDELRPRSALVDAFVYNNPVLMFVKDLAGRYLYSNKAYDEFILKGAPGSAVGLRHADLVLPEIAERVAQEEAEVARTGETFEGLRYAERASGARHVQVLRFPMRDEEGRISAVGTIGRDVTDAVRANQERLEAEKRFRAVLVAAPDAIVISDSDGRIVMVNPAAARMFGRVPESLEGLPMIELVAPEAREAMAQRLASARDAAPAVGATVYNSTGLREDGTTFPIEATSSLLETSGEHWVISVARDVTERQALERQLRQSQKLEAVGQLTGGLAHDFNNILGIVVGNLDLLERAVALDPAAVKRVRTAQQAAQRGTSLTRQMLAFARRQDLAPAVLDANRLIGGIAEMAESTLGKDIRIETTLDPAVAPVFADSAGLELALLNLSINARDAMPGGGTLRISTAPAELGAGDRVLLRRDLFLRGRVHSGLGARPG
jgi:PAS domain S-box-containing protein